MAVEEIPKSYRYNCDRCGFPHTQHAALGHYTNSVPPEWCCIKVTFGRETKKNTKKDVDLLLCEDCKATLVSLLEGMKI